MADEKAWSRDKISSRIDGNELDLSLCGITKVPVKSLIPFSKVTILDLSCNKIHTLPENFTKLIQLVQLDLSKNCLTELPHDFGALTKLKKLDLLENHISKIPLSFRLLNNLVWLDLKGNPIQESFPKLVGDCLKPSECKECAKNVVRYSQALFEEELDKERKKKKKEEEKLSKQIREEDALRQRKKEEKKRRNAERKHALQSEGKTNKKDGNPGDVTTSKDDSYDVSTTHGKSIFHCRLLLLLLLVAMLLMSVIFLFHFRGDLDALKETGLELMHSMELYVNRLFYKDKIK